MTKISNKFDKILPNHHYLAKPACINRDNKIDNLIGSILENNKEKYLKNRFSKTFKIINHKFFIKILRNTNRLIFLLLGKFYYLISIRRYLLSLSIHAEIYEFDQCLFI